MSSKNFYLLRGQLVTNAHKLRIALRTKNIELIEKLSARVSRLIDQLRTAISWLEIRKILAGVGLVVALQASPLTSNAQSFGPSTNNPFGLTEVSNGAWITTADIDDDGDLDIFVGAYSDSTYQSSLIYFENIGTATEPSFQVSEADPFGIQIASDDFIMPTFADVDDDGDLDLFLSNYGGMLFFENIGTPGDPQFGPQETNPFGIVPMDYMYKPVLADLDNDGDLDLLVGTYYIDDTDYEAPIVYYENTGSKSEPQFAEPDFDLLGNTTGFYFSLPSLADLDDDGDLDLMVGGLYNYYSGGYDSELRYYENIGDKANPEFAQGLVNPFGLTGGLNLSYPEFADLDGDGDLDLFVGEVSDDDDDYGSFKYFENLGSSAVAIVLESTRLNVAPVPARDYVDITTDLNLISLELTNAMGMVRGFSPQESKLNISNLASGIYVLRARDIDGDIHQKKIVIVR